MRDIIDKDCFVLNKGRRIAFGIEERICLLGRINGLKGPKNGIIRLYMSNML